MKPIALPVARQALEFYRMCKLAMEPFTEALTHTEKVFGADACDSAVWEYKQDILQNRNTAVLPPRVETTEKEHRLLNAIANSEYQDGSGMDLIDNDIWLDYVIGSKSRGGVLTSLVKKGLVKVHIVEMSKSSNRPNGISDSTVCLTAAGVASL